MRIGMFESFITGHWFSRQAKHLWGDIATLQAWLDVEVALAGAQAELGLIPAEAARVIANHADAQRFDRERLSSDIAFAQHPLVPVLRQFEALCGEPAAGFIHWGATTQNIFDTASALQMQRTHAVVMASLDASIQTLGQQALAHQHTVMPGRTHGQHALPMTFGFKVAGWIDELDRSRQRLNTRIKSSFIASMGGAIGTFASMGNIGPEVESLLAARLGLMAGKLSMRSSYDRVCDYLTALGMLASTAQKMAQDIVFMQRTEIGEVSEAFHMGKIGSSTMAQKRNPSTALLLISLARMLRGRIPLALEAMIRMDEGDASATNVTDALLPEIAILGCSITERLQQLVQGLEIHPEAMRQNLALTHGLIASEAVMMQLSPLIGRHEAHQLLYEAVERTQSEADVSFTEAIREHPVIAAHQHELPPHWTQALEATAYVGESATLASHTAQQVTLKSVPC